MAESKMRILAILAVRNEAQYIRRCLEHLRRNEIDVVLIDNDSSDETLKIASSFRSLGLIDIIRFPYPGFYDWVGILELKQALSQQYHYDWFLHVDADEMHFSPTVDQTLRTAILEVDKLGYSAIDFNEFVFVPIDPEEDYSYRNYDEEMRYYYYFCRPGQHRINAWKKNAEIDLVSSGGHDARFPRRRLYPKKFTMKHFIFLSHDHAQRKYSTRVFSAYEVNSLGWHKQRVIAAERSIPLVNKSALQFLDAGATMPKAIDPMSEHLIFSASEQKKDRK